MPLTSHLRRARTPALVTGLLAASVVGVVVPSASALDISRLPLDSVASSIDQAAPAAARTEDKEKAQPLLPRVRLKAKPAPWVLPVVGYHLTGRFGQVSGLWSSTHTGLDFAAPEGTEIRSIGPGVVVSTAYDGAFGNKTVVRLDDGTVLWYCHQSEFGVDPGQRVKPGDLIGYVGSTGNTTGPHLHLEVHPRGGDAIDPEVWLPEHHLHP
ncbi:M23 family metallopeptidase [Marmoricola sp. URHB0036]|uniref:M23 family metallopeptidase n=1 Tax=Marmoricola sp. URHB0036 TaxID=1298863 RepID=UPI0003FD5481|nr:M23 family metallopeptidase [Marmoricola sp. URHB0036]